MNILIIGNGGREFTFAWKIAQSQMVDKLFIAPGNAGTEQFGMNVPLAVDDFVGLGEFVRNNKVDLVLVGPEVPLVAGLKDFFDQDAELKKVLFIGPGKLGAQLEGSKDFSKVFMNKHGIPTAKSETFTADRLSEGIRYLSASHFPVVLKADGLAAGKGVVIAYSLEEAKQVLTEMLRDKKFGEASSKVLIEEYLDGIELSVFVLTDGKDYLILPEAKDYKRIEDHDKGPNTGGMGAVSPVDFANDAFMLRVKKDVVDPTINGLRRENIPYTGFIFIGLMKVGDIPYVIEYNVRMGDPETQVVIPRIENDFVELLVATGRGELSKQQLIVDERAAATVVMVSEGYPGAYEKGKEIHGLADVTDSLVVHAGTRRDDYRILTDGGRVLSVTGRGTYLEEALNNAYNAVQYISWDGFHYRKDIGKDVLADHLD
jgi:phosphoribosylamine--glycine ligase